MPNILCIKYTIVPNVICGTVERLLSLVYNHYLCGAALIWCPFAEIIIELVIWSLRWREHSEKYVAYALMA